MRPIGWISPECRTPEDDCISNPAAVKVRWKGPAAMWEKENWPLSRDNRSVAQGGGRLRLGILSRSGNSFPFIRLNFALLRATPPQSNTP